MISFLAEFPDIRNNGRPIVETPISIEAARAFNTVGAATLTIPDFIDRRSFRKNTRMRLWRRGLDGTATLFGDTNWFLRKISHNYTSQTYAIEFEDAISLLQHRRVAYTSQTPYADKTLEEFGLIVPNDSLRIDNMMRQYVRENYSTLALDTARNNLLITVEDDRNLGPYGEKEASWQVLGDVLNNLADMSAEKGLELFYDLVPQPDDSMVFKVWDKVRRVDRGSDSFNILTLSQDLNHLTDVEEVEDYTELGTYVYVLGYDTGPSQIIVEVSDEVEIDSDPFGRIEFTEAAPDVDRESVLEDYGQAALRGKRGIRRVSARVVEGAGIVYGRDYSYGDRVMIQVGTRKYNCHVKAVSTRWEAGMEDLDVRLEGYAGHERDAFPTFLLPGSGNQAPVASAGTDQDILSGETANLVGSATDDGLPDPPATLTYGWSKVSGPGTVTFGDATDPTTTADFSVDGAYTLRLSASDSALVDTDDVVIQVASPPPSFGLIEGVEEVAGIGSDGFIYRTSDFQTPSGSGGPTWDRVDTTIADTIYSFVVDPFSPGYLTGVGAINGWIVNDTDIYRVTDLFGSVAAVSVFTFPIPTVAASYHWRTIQASFGAFFDEGTNPWLLCTSYYGDTPGHTGTWATRSMDGGVTWSPEVLVSARFKDAVSTRFNPIGIYTSPRTPGLAYTAAYVDYDLTKLPRWGLITNGGAMTQEGIGISGSASTFALSDAGTDRRTLICAPPANAVRILFNIEWSATHVDVGLGSCTSNLLANTPANVSTTGGDASNFSPPGAGVSGTTSGSFEPQRTLVTGVWAVDKDNIVTSPPVASGANLSNTTPESVSWHLSSEANGDDNNSAEASITVSVAEIEFADGSIYTPLAADNGLADGYTSTDWGETWTRLSADPVDDPGNPLPRWALWHLDPVASGLEVMGLGGVFEATATAEEAGGAAGIDGHEFYIILAAPKDAARVLVTGEYEAIRSMVGGSSSTAGTIATIADGSNQSHTEDLVYTQPGSPNGTSSDTFTIEWTKSGVADWDINSESIITSPPGSVDGCRLRLDAIANSAGSSGYAFYQINVRLTVVEIELEGGYTYTPAPYGVGIIQPGMAHAGQIHIPWDDNTDEELIYFGYMDGVSLENIALKMSDSGTITDISPTDTGVDFGVNHYGFAIRAYDSGRQFMALGGLGNSVSVDPADDQVGLWVSSNAGAAWANILAPVAAAEALHGLQIAFAGDSSDVLFSWGGWSNAATLAAIYYSDDFGATLDSREGNINSLGTVSFIGIAGGPTAP